VSLSDLEFLYFLPAVLLVHWLLPRRAWLQNAFILLASLAFYATWSLPLIPVILAAAAVDFGVGLVLDEAAARPRRVRHMALAASLVFDLGLLGFFKYAGFFAQSLNDLLVAAGLPSSLPVLRLALPLGISYWTIQKLMYVIDVYYGRISACRDPLAFAVYTAFFPQLIAGPISRPDRLLPQLVAPRRLDAAKVAEAGRLLLLGFAMKAWAADFLARHLVDPVFADPSRFDRLSLWAGAAGYGAQVFCDFGGYSFMAMGTALLLGVELPLNFDRPFLARSLLEFWRRWHITLNAFLFDYLFAPLTTGRSWFRGRAWAGFILVFLASGLWHGAMWTFVLWGLLHGIGLAVTDGYDRLYKKLCRKDRAWVARRRSRPYALVAWLLTQAFFVATLVPFRAASIADAGAYAWGMVAGAGGGTVNLRAANLLAAFAFVVAYHLLGFGPGPRVAAAFGRLPAPVRGIVYGAVVVFLFVFVPVGASTFIYAQF
jgi:D-alanyl-lipoteichoic acid acyltransferase DltB (MBOAT superfamily)